MALTRVKTSGGGRMPPVISSVPDAQAIQLLSEWITNSLPEYLSFSEWQVANFESTNAPAAQSNIDADLDGNHNGLEYLTGTDPNLASERWPNVDIKVSANQVDVRYERVANRGFEVQWSTNIEHPIWQPLDVPANAPVFSATNQPASVPHDTGTVLQKIYRVRVFEP
jgi:hypothetical protein